VQVLEPFTGEIVAEHALVAPGEVSIIDEHYGSTRPDKPRRAPRARTAAEKRFLALGEVAETFLTGAAAAGVANLAREIDQILTLHAGHGDQALREALQRAVQLGAGAPTTSAPSSPPGEAPPELHPSRQQRGKPWC
jgi:hypothetical protein